MRAEFEVGPERLKEIAACIERNTAHHIAECSSEKHTQQNAGNTEHDVEESLPNPVLDVSAEFNADAAQNEQPQHNHQRQVKPAEAGRVELRKSKIKCATGSEQPDFVAIPHRANGAQHAASFAVGLRRNQINRTPAKIESIEHDIGRDHRCDNPEPKTRHTYRLRYLASVAG